MKIKSIMIKGAGHPHVVLTTPRKLGGYFLKGRHLHVMADLEAELIKDIPLPQRRGEIRDNPHYPNSRKSLKF